mgnify:CR=1 FL=1
MGRLQTRGGPSNDPDRVTEVRFARHADGAPGDRIDGDVPEAGTRHDDFRREFIERPTMVGVSTAVLETAEIGIVHQADVAGLRAFDDDDVVLVEVLALVYELHRLLRQRTWRQSGQR